ncbi:FRG domain-containing protein [Clostridium sp. KNHs214]|uniref:FRG domain-containing protein n=1 Tax=Clostridium sp. KNHs214 TaxID=1540257 RepID=UPI0005569C18|nr:FRG domain-containing protein [Clostridium sp. KNHs214]
MSNLKNSIEIESKKCSNEINIDAPVVQCIGRANSVQDYLRIIDTTFRDICPSNRNCELWYRGQPQASFNLIPRIARSPLNPKDEILFLSKFKSLAIPDVQFLPSFPIPNGPAAYWHWLFQMQHYGVPTRLMDWSRDAFVGLFFAVTQAAADVGNDAAVWVLNPVILNEAFSFHSFVNPGYIPNVDEPVVDLYFGPNAQILGTTKPAAVIGPMNNPRIVAQRGTFTVFPRIEDVTPLNLFTDASNYLLKICIAAESIDSIKRQLTRYGITRFALFPDLCNIAEEISLQLIQEGQIPSA